MAETTQTLAQKVLNVAIPYQMNTLVGAESDIKYTQHDMWACIIMLAQAVANSSDVSSGPASANLPGALTANQSKTTTVNVRGHK